MFATPTHDTQQRNLTISYYNPFVSSHFYAQHNSTIQQIAALEDPGRGVEEKSHAKALPNSFGLAEARIDWTGLGFED
jgi:hypothetical protein